MNILFDIAHPADVHLFKYPRAKLEEMGHKVVFMARDKDVVLELLNDYNISYEKGSIAQKGFIKLSAELVVWFFNAFSLIRKHNIDVAVSLSSPSTAWAAKLNGVKHIMFDDTETALTQMRMARPATQFIFSPECVKANWGKKHIKYNAIHDLAYLKPKYFTPTPCPELTKNYAIVRFVSWDAAHDWGAHKTQANFQIKICKLLSKNMTVYISAEGKLPKELEQFKIPIKASQLHDALAFAQIVVGDGATTATEAAVLGVPSLYISHFSDKLGYCSLLKKHGLLYTATSQKKGLKILKSILKNKKAFKLKSRKAQKSFLKNTIDLTEFIVKQVLSL